MREDRQGMGHRQHGAVLLRSLRGRRRERTEGAVRLEEAAIWGSEMKAGQSEAQVGLVGREKRGREVGIRGDLRKGWLGWGEMGWDGGRGVDSSAGRSDCPSDSARQ